MGLDAVFRGRREGSACYLAVKASVGVGVRDVTRARERADLLTRTSTPTVPVVAGDWVNPGVAEASGTMGVWRLTNGGAVAPAG